MRYILGLVCVGLIAVGCSGAGSVEDRSAEVERLESQLAALEIQLELSETVVEDQLRELEDARRIADTAAANGGDRECVEKLARCEELLFPPDDSDVWPPLSPDVWFPPASEFVTNESAIKVEVFASESASVMVSGVASTQSSDGWVGGNAIFYTEVTLDVGANVVEVRVDDELIDSLEVQYDPGLVRRYGRVLDSRATILPPGSTDVGVEEGCGSGEDNACLVDELGIDFGDMDLEPDYGQGDFEAGDVAVEFYRLTPTSAAFITTHTGKELTLTGASEIWDFFSWGETNHFDVWNILINDNTLVQIEGVVPLGD